MTDADLGGPLLDQLPWVVRIRDAAGRVRGGGVLLGTGWVVTCAHVVADNGEPPTGPVVVDSPQGGWAEQCKARVADRPWVLNSEPDCLDLAVLRLERSPLAATGAPFAWDQAVPFTQMVMFYGYPRAQPDGYWASATVLGAGNQPGCVQMNAHDPDDIQPGFSGSAVIAGESGVVVGLLVSKLVGKGRAWMLPAGAIKHYLQEVPELRSCLELPRGDAPRAEVAIGARLNLMYTRLMRSQRAIRKVKVRDAAAPSTEQPRFRSTEELASTLRRLEVRLISARRKGRPVADTNARLAALEHEMTDLMATLTPAWEDLAKLDPLANRLGLFMGVAAGQGVAERPEIMRRHDAARAALNTQPCDVTHAERLVEAFIQEVRYAGGHDAR